MIRGAAKAIAGWLRRWYWLAADRRLPRRLGDER